MNRIICYSSGVSSGGAAVISLPTTGHMTSLMIDTKSEVGRGEIIDGPDLLFSLPIGPWKAVWPFLEVDLTLLKDPRLVLTGLDAGISYSIYLVMRAEWGEMP